MEREKQIYQLLLAVLALEPSQRDAYLVTTCQDPSIISEIYTLLEAYQQAEEINFLGSNALEKLVESNYSLTGRTLGDFLIHEQIGIGGFGVVYRAEQLSLAREAVVKVLHQKHHYNKEVIERFMREARLAAHLEHPYTAHIYAFGAETDGTLWMAMEMIHGTPLDRLLQTQGPIPLNRFIPLLIKICEVVQTAHDYGIVHRDLKPANVMVISRAGCLLPKLLDFGIAKWLDLDHQIMLPATQSSTSTIELRDDDRTIGLLGSASYMSLEQWESAVDVDARADIYALGVLSYEVITGQYPFSTNTPTTLAGYYHAHKNLPVLPLDEAFPAALNEVMATVMAKLPEQRYGSAMEFCNAFQLAAGYTEKRISLPQLDETLNSALITKGPQPLAEAVAALSEMFSAHQALNQISVILQVALRYIGILALACRTKIGSGNKTDSDLALNALRKLRSDSLTLSEWWTLAKELCRPFACERAAFPMPELVSLFFAPGSTQPSSISKHVDQLLIWQQKITHSAREKDAIEELIQQLRELSQLLEALSFLLYYRIVSGNGNKWQQWSGLRVSPLADDTIDRQAKEYTYLIDMEECVLLSLWPIVQAAQPSPGSPESLFFFEGKGRYGAKLVALPYGFERHDESIWEWFRTHFFSDNTGKADKTTYERTPYLGLTAFTTADTDLFFGRERESDAFLNRLRIQPMLVLVGASGAGKSSFIQAGVIAELPTNWQAITIRPGSTPFATLEQRLKKSGIEITKLREQSINNCEYLTNTLRAFTEKHAITLVLVVDQFEELFTLCTDSEERQLFSKSLMLAAQSAEDSIRLVIITRDDFLIRAKQLPGLRDRLTTALELLVTPAREELIQILKKPAQQFGYEFEDEELPEEIVKEIADQPGALPLLAFTVARLWEFRDRHFKKLLRQTYQAMGGVGGALAQHAEATLMSMTQQEQSVVRETFRQLITSEGTRAFLPLDELTVTLGNRMVVEKLISARLLVVSEGEQGRERIEIAHEALITAWPRLIKWRQEDRESVRLRDQLRSAANQWHERGRPQGLLWRDEALIEYRIWRASYPGKITEIEAAFANASLADAVRIQRRRNLFAVLLFIILATGLLVLAWQRNETEKNAQQALMEKERAEAKTLEAHKEKLRADEQRQRAETNALEAQQQSEIAKKNAQQAKQISLQAEENAAQARDKLLDLYEEQGRQELLRGNHARALIYLNEVYQAGRYTSALRFMLAQCLAPIDAQLWQLTGHKSLVSIARFSPNGKQVVTASDDNSVKVWDVASGHLQHSLTGHTFNIIKVDFSQDGNLILTASLDNTVRVWNAYTGEQLVSLNIDKGLISTATFSLDGHQLAILEDDNNIKVWDLLAAQPIAVIKAHTQPIKAISLSPDNKHIATASTDKTAIIWDKASSKAVFTLGPQSTDLTVINYSSDGRRLVTATKDGSLRIWDALEGKLIAASKWPATGIQSALFSPLGDKVITVSEDRVARVWEAESGKLFTTIPNFNSELSTASFSPDGLRIIAASNDKTAKVWDTVSGKLLDTLQGHSAFVTFAAFSPDGKRMVTSSADKTAQIWDTSHSKLLSSLAGYRTRNIISSFSNNGEKIVTINADRTAKVSNTYNGKLLVVLAGHKKNINSVSFSPDDKYLVTASADNTAKIWDSERGNTIFTLMGHKRDVLLANFNTDGKQLVTTSMDKTVRVWNTRTGDCIAILKGHKEDINTAIFHPDGRYLITASEDSIKVWDIIAGKELLSIPGHKTALSAVNLSSDGEKIITVNTDRIAKVWNTYNGKLLAVLAGHKKSINSVSFSPDGKYIVTASADNTAKVWDAQTGRLISSLDDHSNEVLMASFSPDSQLIVTASRDSMAKIWEAATGKLLDSLEGHRYGVLSASFSKNGFNIITTSLDNTAKIWNIRLESRNRRGIAKIIREKNPFWLDQGRLIPQVR
ncbi:MAG: protein kinase [Acidobacteriota bacterium]